MQAPPIVYLLLILKPNCLPAGTPFMLQHSHASFFPYCPARTARAYAMLSRSAFTLGLIMSLVSHAAVFAAPCKYVMNDLPP